MILRFFPILVAALFVSACQTTTIPDRSNEMAVPALRGAVSAADPRASEAGVQILRQGGSATDAAIAMMLALTVVEPQSSGIGGGGFYVRADADGTVETLDGRETAPAAAGPDWFLDAEGEPLGYRESVMSGLSIGVPANIALAAEAHARYGRLPWADLFAPAIALASDGWEVTDRLILFLDLFEERAKHQPFGRSLFFDADGEPFPIGTRLTNPELAATFAQIAADGPDAFYNGEYAQDLAAAISAATPRAGMVAQDVAEYEAKWREPVCAMYRAYRICGMGPPSSGATTVLAMLGQLEQHDLAALGPASPTSWHLFVESQRLAYADRELYLADSDFVPVPAAGLIDAEYLRSRGALIEADARLADAKAGIPPGAPSPAADGDEPVENGTSHFSAADQWGNAVSYTSTIEGPFGSGYAFGGFFLNNELTDFSASPMRDGMMVANRVEGGKRPRSSMAPTVVFAPDGHIRLVIGAAGGSTIPVQVTKAIIGVIDWGLSAHDALALPTAYGPADSLVLEEGSDVASMQEYFEALGHEVTTRRLPLKANAVEWRDGRWIGAADPRSEGTAVTQ